MIRINLLTVERERKKRTARVLIPPAHRVTVGASLILLATMLGIGWWFLSLRKQSMEVDAAMVKAEADMQQLRNVLGQVQKFESRKAQLQQRVTLIEKLRQGQSGPVHVLDKISRSLPERLWLTDLKQTGAEFSISGFSTSMTGLSEFIANLEATRWFRRPVEIVDSRVQDDAKAGELVKFTIKATFTDPTAAPAPKNPAGGANAAKGAR